MPALFRAFAIALAILHFGAPTASAQQPSLDLVEAHLERGEYAEARAAIGAWWNDPAADRASGDERARALLLRARLATEFADAIDDYLTIAFNHPSSPQAPVALLRLGQGFMAAGEPDRAAVYFERLIHDHPRDPDRELAQRGLARAREAAGTSAVVQRDAADATGRAETPAAATRPSTGGAAAPATERAAEGRYAVQAGAFRERAGANALAERLRGAGFEARIVALEGNALLRVRVGRFADAAAAEALVQHLRAAGFEALVVRIVAPEQTPR